MKLFSQGRYATVASTLALVVALGGTSYAAAMLTGADITDGTITSADVKNNNLKSKDVKNGALKLKDFSTGAKTGLQGAPGPAGPAGPQGPQGAQGPTGPSNAYSVWNDGTTVMSGSNKTLLTLNVPNGLYVVNSKALVQRNATGGRAWAWCTLSSATASDQNTDEVLDLVNAIGSVSNQIVTGVTGDPITLECFGTARTNVAWKKITAVKVGSISNTAGPNVAKNGPAKTPQG